MSILDIIDEIAENSGKIYKKETIEKYKDDDLFIRVLKLTYNPNITYRIKELPIVKDYTDESKPLSDALDILDLIIARTLKGNEAITELTSIISKLLTEDEIVLRRIIDRSLKLGCNVSTINKAIPGTIPTTPYMGAVSFNEKKARKLFIEDEECEIDVKMDGRYVNIICKDDDIEMVSRQGKNSFINNPKLISTAKYMSKYLTNNNDIDDDIVLNGELMIKGVSRYEANGMLASIIKITEKELEGLDVTKDKAKFKKKHMDFDKAVENVYVTVWDFLPYKTYMNAESWSTIRKNRLYMLESAMPVLTDVINLVEYKIVKTYDEAISYFRELLNKGEEGAILKSLYGTWENKKPIYQIKMKLEFTVDLKIIGFNEGEKGSKFEGMLGSLQCESSDSLLKADPGGYNDDLRQTIWNNKDSYIDKIVEVKCNGISHDKDNNYSLLHPVFKEIRDDTTADSLEQIIENENMVLGLTNESKTTT